MSGTDPTGYGWLEKIFSSDSDWEGAALPAYLAVVTLGAAGGSVAASNFGGGLAGIATSQWDYAGLYDMPGANNGPAPTGEFGSGAAGSQGGLYNESAVAPPAGPDERIADSETWAIATLGPNYREHVTTTEEAVAVALIAASRFVGPALPALARWLAARGGTTTLYRAVSPAEAAQVLENGTFQAGANSLGGKWFATTAEHAAAWGRAMYGSQPFTVLEAQIPTSSVRGMMQVGKLDGIGPAVYAELEQLGGAVIKVFAP